MCVCVCLYLNLKLFYGFSSAKDYVVKRSEPSVTVGQSLSTTDPAVGIFCVK